MFQFYVHLNIVSRNKFQSASESSNLPFILVSYFCFTGSENAGRCRRHFCHFVAPIQRHAGLQQFHNHVLSSKFS